jgi:hypothetical protein
MTPDEQAAADAAAAEAAAKAEAEKEAAKAKAKGKGEKHPLDGKKSAYLVGVHGRIIHPFKPEVDLDVGQAQKVEIDDWVRIQFDAGKIALASDDE